MIRGYFICTYYFQRSIILNLFSKIFHQWNEYNETEKYYFRVMNVI